MSDCALAIYNAVARVYKGVNNAPQHYWCLFHVLKAFKGKAKTYLGDQWGAAFSDFREIMYAQDNPKILLDNFCLRWGKVSEGFVKYVHKQWGTKLHHWSISLRTVHYFSPQF